VGNGSGMVEQNIIYTYVALPNFINSCLNYPQNCVLRAKEEELLKRIGAIVVRAENVHSRIDFKSEAETPGFFATGPTEFHRISKTLQPEDPIFFNSDLLYANGRPALDIPEIAAHLVHEIGHQTGINGRHNELHELGAKIRQFMIMQRQEMIFPGLPIKLTVFGAMSAFSQSEAYLLVGDKSRLITRFFSDRAKSSCSSRGLQPVGWSIHYMNWIDPIIVSQTQEGIRVPFAVWMETSCLTAGNMLTRSIESFTATIEAESKENTLELSRLR
jgi:hypothetical protein